MTVEALKSRDVPTLVELLERQCRLYTDLKSFSDQQAKLIAGGLGDEADSEQLLRLLAQRQRVIDELTQLHDRLAPWRNDWDAYWAKLSSADQQRIGPLVRQVESMLAQIIKQDEIDRRQLEAARQHVGAQMQRVISGGGALNAYRAAQSAGSSNRFTNQQG